MTWCGRTAKITAAISLETFSKDVETPDRG